MPQMSKARLRKDVESSIKHAFVYSLRSLKTKDQAIDFIASFLSTTEQVMLSKRLAVALMIRSGYSYAEIKSLLKVSQGTIAKVSEELKLTTNEYTRLLDNMIKQKQFDVILNKITQILESIFPPPQGKNWSEWHRKKRDKRIQRIRREERPF